MRTYDLTPEDRVEREANDDDSQLGSDWRTRTGAPLLRLGEVGSLTGAPKIKCFHIWVKPNATKGRFPGPLMNVTDQIKNLKIKSCLMRLIVASVHCLYQPRFKSQDKD